MTLNAAGIRPVCTVAPATRWSRRLSHRLHSRRYRRGKPCDGGNRRRVCYDPTARVRWEEPEPVTMVVDWKPYSAVTLLLVLVACTACMPPEPPGPPPDPPLPEVASLVAVETPPRPSSEIVVLDARRRSEGGDDLSLPVVDGGRLTEGWVEPDEDGSWALMPWARLDLDLPDGRQRHLLIECRANGRLRMEVVVNGLSAGQVEVDETLRWRGLALSLDLIREGRNAVWLGFEPQSTIRPLAVGEQRALPVAVQVRRVAAVARDIAPELESAVDLARQTPEPPRMRVVLGRGGGLPVPGRSALGIPVISPNRTRLRPGLPPGADQLGSFGVTVTTVGDGPSAHARYSLGEDTAPPLIPRDKGWAWRGRVGVLGVDLDIGISEPVSVEAWAEPAPMVHQPIEVKPASRREDLADIVLVVLSGARPDHLSGYGYRRQTSPEIDGVMESAVVFDNAFTLAPETRSALATLLTGQSFIEHGVTGPEGRLAEDRVTLAEVLAEGGYRTVAVSGSA